MIAPTIFLQNTIFRLPSLATEADHWQPNRLGWELGLGLVGQVVS